MSELPDPGEGYRVRAVIRAAAVLDLLRESVGGATLNDLTHRSGLAKASVFRMLRTLDEPRLVERVPGSDVYRFGIRCLELGQAYLEHGDLRSEAAAVLQRLRGEFDETVHLGVLDDELRVVFLEKLETRHAVGLMMSRVGRTSPSHYTGLGKALLSGREGDPVQELHKCGVLRRYTPRTRSTSRRRCGESSRVSVSVVSPWI